MESFRSHARRQRTRAVAFAIGVILLTTHAGCGGKSASKDRTVVTGTVSLKGQPLRGGTINFELPDGSAGTGVMIDSGGKYATDRAPLGLNRVTIETESLKFGNGAAYIKIPAKYANAATSGLSAEVKAGENADVNFDLQE
jgi:hypothetical protein